MSKWDAFIRKINFKKFVIVYLAAAVLAGVLSIGFLAFVFKDKLTL